MKNRILKIILILLCIINVFLFFPVRIYAAGGVEDAISGADDFLKKGTPQINDTKLKESSDTIYNALLIVGVALTAIIGVVLGIKFMIASAEDKAKIKEAFVPYIIGCIVIYGAFGIWRVFLVLGNKLN